MLKNIVKFLLIIQITIVIGIAGKNFMNTEIGSSIREISLIPASLTAKQSVYVTDEDGNIQKNSLMGSMIEIKEDNMTISGTAKTECFIDIDEDVETVIIDNLNQDEHSISISIRKGSACKVIFSGSNEVFDIFCESPLTVEGADGESELTLTNSIYVYNEELTVQSGKIITPQMYADGNITINGDSRVYLKPMEDQDDEYIYARLESYDKIIINLSDGGLVDIEGNKDKDLYTTYSSAGFELGENTAITLPENGYAGLWNPEYDDEYCIMDENGEDINKVIIEAVE